MNNIYKAFLEITESKPVLNMYMCFELLVYQCKNKVKNLIHIFPVDDSFLIHCTEPNQIIKIQSCTFIISLTILPLYKQLKLEILLINMSIPPFPALSQDIWMYKNFKKGAYICKPLGGSHKNVMHIAHHRGHV